MAKKKNTDTTTQTINDEIKYKGNVTIKYVNKGKHKSLKAHNNGTNYLFTLLTKILAGDIGLSNSMPYYLMAYDKQEETKTPLLTNNVYISTTPIRLDSSNKATTGLSTKVQYQFTVPYAYYIDSTKDINYLELLDSSNNICATLDLATPISGYAGSTMLISWVLSFSVGN